MCKSQMYVHFSENLPRQVPKKRMCPGKLGRMVTLQLYDDQKQLHNRHYFIMNSEKVTFVEIAVTGLTGNAVPSRHQRTQH